MPSIAIRAFQPADAAVVSALNREWLVRYDLLEPADEPFLADPCDDGVTFPLTKPLHAPILWVTPSVFGFSLPPREARTVIVCAYDSADSARLRDRARQLVGMSLMAALTLAPGALVAKDRVIAPSKDRVTVALSATIMSSDGELHATVRVDPQEENRVLTISLDGPLYFASTDVQLDGSNSKRVHDLWWRHIPPGDYAVTATVRVDTGRVFVEQRHMKVIGGAEFPGQ
jgi:hypothetical protein